jgi:predicted transcriptional regulator
LRDSEAVSEVSSYREKMDKDRAERTLKIVKLRDEGKPIADIGVLLSVSSETVRKYLRYYDGKEAIEKKYKQNTDDKAKILLSSSSKNNNNIYNPIDLEKLN